MAGSILVTLLVLNSFMNFIKIDTKYSALFCFISYSFHLPGYNALTGILYIGLCNVHAAAEMFLSIQHCQLLKISIYCKLNFNFTDTFEEALRLEKRAVETSNLQDDYHEQNS